VWSQGKNPSEKFFEISPQESPQTLLEGENFFQNPRPCGGGNPPCERKKFLLKKFPTPGPGGFFSFEDFLKVFQGAFHHNFFGPGFLRVLNLSALLTRVYWNFPEGMGPP